MSKFSTSIQIEWTPSLPVYLLPDEIKEIFRDESSILLKELKDKFLDVKLTPAPEQKHHNHMIRSVENSNPEWYSYLHGINRSTFRRSRVEKYLKKILGGIDKPFYVVHTEIRYTILKRLLEGYLQDGREVPPNKIICEAFSV